MSLLNYYNLHTLQTNMVDIDAYEESSSDVSDSISGDTSSFYAEVRVAQNQIYNAENPTRLPHPRKSEITQRGVKFIFETVCETKICEKDRASFGK